MTPLFFAPYCFSYSIVFRTPLFFVLVNVTGTGNVNASGTITGGNIVIRYQDVAEWVPS